MSWKPARHSRRYAAETLLLALLCLVLQAPLATVPALASTIQLHYEDAFEDVKASEETSAEIKAAFLLRFPDFIRWQRVPGDTLRIGVTGDNALLSSLVHLVEQERQSGLASPHVIVVGRVSSVAEAQRCQILVLGEAAVPDFVPSFMQVHKAGTLTVGVWDKPRSGAVIRLFREGNRVRFDISQSLAKEAGLSISSKLLNLARAGSSQVVVSTIEPTRG